MFHAIRMRFRWTGSGLRPVRNLLRTTRSVRRSTRNPFRAIGNVPRLNRNSFHADRRAFPIGGNRASGVRGASATGEPGPWSDPHEATVAAWAASLVPMLAVVLWLLYALPAYVLYTLVFRVRYGFSPVAERFPPRTLYQWMDTLLFVVLNGYSAWLVLGRWPERTDAISVGGGAALWSAGVILRWWAIAALGPHWRIGQDEGDGRAEFVARGPYRFVRHPINIGLVLVAGGMVLLSGVEARALVLLGYAAVYYLVQGRIEDRRWGRARGSGSAGRGGV